MNEETGEERRRGEERAKRGGGENKRIIIRTEKGVGNNQELRWKRSKREIDAMRKRTREEDIIQ